MLGGIDDWRRAKKEWVVVVVDAEEVLASPLGSVLVGRVVPGVGVFADSSTSSPSPPPASGESGCVSVVVSFSISRWACVTT